MKPLYILSYQTLTINHLYGGLGIEGKREYFLTKEDADKRISELKELRRGTGDKWLPNFEVEENQVL